jgi:hypothetical protein
MKALVINCSKDYNLGTEKIASWLRRNGYEVTKSKSGNREFIGYDKVFLSALYTWDLPMLVKEAKKATNHTEVEIGGPAASIMEDYIFAETGIKPVVGLDNRFESEPAHYLSTYTSRGCIRNCEFCSVPLVEGGLREIPNFIPTSYILDANFLACSRNHIENACEKLSALRFVDFLHGLDARLLKPWQVELIIKKLKMVVWRFTFDSLRHESDLKNVFAILKDYGIKPEERVIVYCLYGFKDTAKDAYERAKQVISLGAHPYGMRFQPLDALSKDSHIPDGWDSDSLKEFGDFCNKLTLAWLYELLRRYSRV